MPVLPSSYNYDTLQRSIYVVPSLRNGLVCKLGLWSAKWLGSRPVCKSDALTTEVCTANYIHTVVGRPDHGKPLALQGLCTTQTEERESRRMAKLTYKTDVQPSKAVRDLLQLPTTEGTKGGVGTVSDEVQSLVER